MTSPFLAAPGAVESADTGVASHYGNPLAEQRALKNGAIVDLSHRGVITVTGPDRLSWLNSVLSQELGRLAPGVSTEALLLGASGRVEHAIRIVDDGETAWLVVHAAAREGLTNWLNSMRFMLRVVVTDVSDQYAVLGWASPDGERPDVPARVIWSDPWRSVAVGGVQYAAAEEHPGADWVWNEAIVDRSRLDDIAASASATPAGLSGLLAFDALRIEAWRPQLPDEGDDLLLPHEVDWLRSAVHLSKGCYRGQETVAKVHNLGHPPRRLTFLHLDGSESALPAKGDPVRDADGAEVGVVTSAALHYELGPIALALLRRNTPSDAVLVVHTGETAVAANQEVIVPADAGSAVTVPRLPRLGRKTR